MESFSYSNIFETKGIEYLAIIAFFAILIPFWFLLNRKMTARFQKIWSDIAARISQIPQGIYHCKNHTWAFLEKSGEATVGLDELLTHITGEVKFMNLKNSGEFIKKGDLLAEIEQSGKSLKIFSPISGKIINANSVLTDNLKTVNNSYEEGWVYKIKPTNWKAESSAFFLADEAVDWSKKELIRFKDFMTNSLQNYAPYDSMTILQDGGELRDNALADCDANIWQQFQNDFLNDA